MAQRFSLNSLFDIGFRFLDEPDHILIRNSRLITERKNTVIHEHNRLKVRVILI